MIRLRDIGEAWDRFFFTPESPLPIAVYRILLGALIFFSQALFFPDVLVWFGTRGVLTPATAKLVSGGTGFNLFALLPITDGSVWFLYSVSLLASLLLTLGLFTRAAAIATFLCLVSFHHRDTLPLNSGDSFVRIASFFMMFAPAGAALSVDRYLRLRRGVESGPPAPRAPWATRLIQLQLSFLYLHSFVAKSMGAMWIGGTALYYTSRLMEFWRFPSPYLFEHMWTIEIATWSTLAIEFALGTLVWIKELRYWVLLGGVLLHLGIDYTMNIPLFAFTMITAYVTFVEPDRIQSVVTWIERRLLRRPVRVVRPAPRRAPARKGA